MRIGKILLPVVVAAVATLSVLGIAAADDAPAKPLQNRPTTSTLPTIPPPLSRKRAEYFNQHPDEFKALMQKLSRRPARAQSSARTAPAAAVAGTWRPVTNLAPEGALTNPLLLTDGTVIVHVFCSGNWYKLTPSIDGDYASGTWSKIASLPGGYAPGYFASQVLSDGKVIVNGGEYDGCDQVWTSKGAIYNPAKNTWTTVAPPTNPGPSGIGDAQSVILPNGTYMLADSQSTHQYRLNAYPSLTWTSTGSGKADINDEEGWTLLQNGQVLTTDAYVHSGCGRKTEIYDPSTGSWSYAGDATTQLSDCTGNTSYEVGPVVMVPNGSAVAFSGVSSGVAGTSIFGSALLQFNCVNLGYCWRAGPNVPTLNGEAYHLVDAPAIALPNGSILVAASPGYFNNPTHFWELNIDFNNFVFTQVGDTPYAPSNASYLENFLILPTGEILATEATDEAEIYTPLNRTPYNLTIPSITSIPSSVSRGQDYSVQGTRLNGVTNGGYGDDQQSSTNFPLVLFVNKATGHQFFARTHDFSNRAISDQNTSTAKFTVNIKTEPGANTVYAIANGVRSQGVSVMVR